MFIIHSRQRADKNAVNDELKIDLDVWKQEYDFDLKGLTKVIDFRPPDQYLCTYTDGSWEWKALHHDLKQVKDYFDYLKKNPKSNNIDDDVDGYDPDHQTDYSIVLEDV